MKIVAEEIIHEETHALVLNGDQYIIGVYDNNENLVSQNEVSDFQAAKFISGDYKLERV